MRVNRFVKSTLFFFSLSAAIFSCSTDDDDSSDDKITANSDNIAVANLENPSIVDIAAGDDRFSTLVSALTQADLVETLKGEGPFTVFAPVNDAFAAIDKDALTSLLADKKALTDVLLYHVIVGASVPSSDALGLTDAKMANGDSVSLEVRDGALYLNGNSKVVITDIKAKNGVIHVIDTVLLPKK